MSTSKTRPSTTVRRTAFCTALVAAAVAGAQPVSEPAEPSAAGEPTVDGLIDTKLQLQLAQAQPSDDLLIFEDVPVVISASRRVQRLSELAVPVSVVNWKDIHYRGETDLPEMLTLVPGLNVLRVDRNRWAVGVRGLHDEFADRTIVLINGRNAGSPVMGTTDWGALPVLAEDIDRIEVVRGPGGAVWGANAFNGAINIITKKPEDSLGFLASTRLNEYGDTYSHLRAGVGDDKLAVRVSLGYESHESSEHAIDGDDFLSRDFGRTLRYDAEAVYRFSPDARLRFGIAGSHAERGDSDFGSLWPMRDERLDHERLFARLEREFDGGGSGYVQWFCNIASENRPSLFRIDSVEHDLEAQYAWTTSAENRVMVGGNVRLIRIEQEIVTAEDIIFPDQTVDETWVGAFVTDRWQASERLALEGQFRVDNYSETKADWSARAALLYAVDAEQRHVLRLAAAKAFRAPLLTLRGLSTQRLPLPSPPAPPGMFGVTLIPPEDLDHERVYSLEAGYTGQLSEHLSARVNAYYNHYTDLIGIVTINPAPFVGTLGNIDGASGYGVEAELTCSYKGGRAYVWYAYNALDTDRQSQEVRAYYPAEHAVGAGVRHELADWLTANADYRYTDATHGSVLINSAPVTHRLDLSLTAAVLGGRGEVQLGVEDVFESTRGDFLGVGNATAHDTPGRTLFIRVQYRF